MDDTSLHSFTETVVLDDTTSTWSSDVAREWLLDAGFTDNSFKQSIRDIIDSGSVVCQNVTQFDKLMQQFFLAIAEKGGVTSAVREQQAAWQRFIGETWRTLLLYRKDGKPNPDAVFWPDPTRDGGGGRSVFESIPVVENYGIVTKDTPIGSAGSCFAIELSKDLMERGFNYVFTERSGNPEVGVVAAHTEYDNPIVQYSANWGILFNSPSFAQIAEKSFGIRDLPRIVFKSAHSGDFLGDPYRDGIYFKDLHAYERDFEMHTAASRKALLKCEVFIITLGLNECWEFTPDGSVISSNPACTMMTPYLRHRILSVEENVTAIQRFIDTVRRHNPGLKLIISVSPIPFLATGRADRYHVVTANGHSKAVLRVAAEELVNGNEEVYYFPSYELVTYCSQDPWETDGRHVNRETVARIMDMFGAMFVKDVRASPSPHY